VFVQDVTMRDRGLDCRKYNNNNNNNMTDTQDSVLWCCVYDEVIVSSGVAS